MKVTCYTVSFSVLNFFLRQLHDNSSTHLAAIPWNYLKQTSHPKYVTHFLTFSCQIQLNTCHLKNYNLSSTPESGNHSVLPTSACTHARVRAHTHTHTNKRTLLLSTYVLNIKLVELTSDEAELNQILHKAEAQSYRGYISRHQQSFVLDQKSERIM